MKLWLLFTLFLTLSFTILLEHKVLVSAQAEDGDVLEGEDEANVEEEPATDEAAPSEGSLVSEKGDEEAEVDDGAQLKPHPDINTYLLITKPTGLNSNELPAGKDVSFLVGLSNKGNNEFLIESMDASFRYAMDFSFHLQNFSAIGYNKLVKAREEATFAYSFFVSEAYSTRPYGFTVNLFYKDGEGNQYLTAVFNETVSIIEIDEGLDGETFFLYVFLVAVVVLVLVGLQQFLASVRRKRSAVKPKIEMGTSNPNDVDYDWLPQNTLQALNKSPKVAKTSPRQRRVKRGTGSGDD